MFRGGGETYTLNLARELQKLGCKPSFLLSKPIFGNPRYPLDEFQTHYVYSPYLRDLSQKISGVIKHIRVKRFLRYLEASVQKTDMIFFRNAAFQWMDKHSEHYDIVQVLSNPQLAGRISKNLHIPTVVFFPGPPSIKTKGGLKQCTAVTTDGYAIHQMRKIRPDACKMPIGIDARRFRPIKTDVRDKYFIGKNDIVFLFVGRFVPLKNLPCLLKSFSKLNNKTTKKYWLMLVGDGPLFKEIQKLSVELEIRDNVIFTGPVHYYHLPAYYSAADIFVMTSTYENSPNALLEAMSCGLPVIATNVGGIPELVGSKGSELLVNADDMHGFVSSMKRLAQDATLRNRMSTYFRKICIQRYTWQKTASLYLELYKGILQRTT